MKKIIKGEQANIESIYSKARKLNQRKSPRKINQRANASAEESD